MVVVGVVILVVVGALVVVEEIVFTITFFDAVVRDDFVIGILVEVLKNSFSII